MTKDDIHNEFLDHEEYPESNVVSEEAQKHINNIIDNYNSQMDFYKPASKQAANDTKSQVPSDLPKAQYEMQSGERQIEGEAFRTQQREQENQTTDGYETCPHCSRKFYSGRLALHLKSCKPTKPFKSVKRVSTSTTATAAPTEEPESISNQSQAMQKSQVAQKITTSNMNLSQVQPNSIEEERHNSVKYNIDQYEDKIALAQQQLQSEDDKRVECALCGRKFMADRIQKHEVACQKAQKPRQVYNSSAARAPIDENGKKLINKPIFISAPKEKSEKPTDKTTTTTTTPNKPEVTQPKAAAKSEQNAKANSSKPIPKWKLEHEQFIDNIRYNKKVAEVEKQGGDISSIEKPIDNSQALGFVCCPYCQRNFAKLTADRHIPLCKNIINRPKPPRQVSRQQSNKNATSTPATNTPPLNELKKIALKKVVSRDESNQNTMSAYEGYSKSTQSETNDTSDQNSVLSSKTIGSSKSSQRSTITKKMHEDNIKSRTGLLPDINAKDDTDKKYFTSRKFGILSNQQKNAVNKSDTLRNYEDVYTRTQQISTVSCPYCERVFAKNAADRHIPICKHIVNRPNPFSDSVRNSSVKNNLPKRSQPGLYSQRPSLASTGVNSQLSPRFNELNKITIGNNENCQKPSTTDGASHQMHMKISRRPIGGTTGTSSATSFCGFCGFQFAADHKYCGCCGKKRSTLHAVAVMSTLQN